MFISIRSVKFLNQCLCMVAQVLSHFDLCSLKDDTFEKLMMIKSNHHSKHATTDVPRPVTTDVPRPLTNDLWVFLFQTIDTECVK